RPGLPECLLPAALFGIEPPFGLRPRAGGPDDGRIDLGVPVPVALGIGLALQRVEDLAPGAVFVPQREPVVAGLPRPVLARDGPPGRAVSSAPEDPVDDPPMVAPGLTALPGR